MSSVSFSLNEMSEANTGVLKETVIAHLDCGGFSRSLEHRCKKKKGGSGYGYYKNRIHYGHIQDFINRTAGSDAVQGRRRHNGTENFRQHRKLLATGAAKQRLESDQQPSGSSLISGSI